MTHRVVVIGGDAAGMSAAHQALRTASAAGRELQVTVLEASEHTSYSACGIPYWLAGEVSGPDQLVARTAEKHREAGIDLRMSTRATEIDLEAREITACARGGVERLGYDDLVFATGAKPFGPAWAEGVQGVGPVKTLDDGAVWLDQVAAARERRGADLHVVIGGGGYIGVEMAEAVRARGMGCTLLTRSSLLAGFDDDVVQPVREAMQAAGVEVIEQAAVTGVDCDDSGWVRAVRTDDREYPADLVVTAFGVRPATDLLADSDLLGAHDALVPDATGQVADGLWAAGDCCLVRNLVSGRNEFLPLGTHANKLGRVVGTNLGAGEQIARFPGALGTVITRFAAQGSYVEIARTGLSATEAQDAGLRAQSLTTRGSTASGYMPEAESMSITVVAEEGTRGLLGVQIVGGHGAGKRIDAAAAALWGEMSVDDLAWMDLAYAPPFATAWEVLSVAARRLAERLDR